MAIVLNISKLIGSGFAVYASDNLGNDRRKLLWCMLTSKRTETI